MTAKKILVLGSLAESLVNFRGDLLRALVGAGHQVVAAAPAGPQWVDEALQRWQVRRVVVPLARTGMNPAADLGALFSLWRLLRAERPDAVLAYTIKPVIYGLLAARLAGVPHRVALITGLGFSFQPARTAARSLLQGLIRRLYRLALHGADTVIFQNRDDEHEFRARGLLRAGQRVSVVAGSGINVERYPLQPLPSGPRRFLLIARLLADKGVHEYLQAALRLHALRTDVTCHLVGPLEDHPAAVAKAVIDEAVAAGAIVYHGVLRDVRPQLAAAHVYVLPSYREGMPRTVLEAMASGRPIITTDAPGCRETVVDGRNGVLVAVADAEALLREMLRFVDMGEAELARMATASRDIAVRKFDVHHVNAAIMGALGLDA